MNALFLLALVATGALAAPTAEQKLEHRLRELLKNLEKKTLFDKNDPTPIKHPIERTAALLDAHPDLADALIVNADVEAVTDLLKQVMGIFFEAIPAENKATVLSRFVEGYADHVVYSEKNSMLKIANEVQDSLKRSSRKVLAAVNLALRYPSMAQKRVEAEEGESSGPYVFGISDAVNFYVVQPDDELVADLYDIAYPEGEEYLGGVFYDIEALRTDGYETMSVRKVVTQLSHLLHEYLQDPVVRPAEGALEALGSRIMQFGRSEQAIDAQEAPPVRGLSPEDEETWAAVCKAFKTSNKALSHAIRRVAKYLNKNKMQNLSNELGLYIVELLVPDSKALENADDEA